MALCLVPNRLVITPDVARGVPLCHPNVCCQFCSAYIRFMSCAPKGNKAKIDYV